jgi:hypothetical protein
MTENMFTSNKKILKIPKGVVRIRKSKKDRPMAKRKRTNNNLQNIRLL